MKRITKIEAADTGAVRKLRVAAYARVSTDSEEQLISLDAQKNHYEVLIRSRRDWEYAGLYYDEGISGTKMAKRDGLLSMLCRLRERADRLYHRQIHQSILPKHSREH